jgi:hypothetical protein
MQNNYNSDTLMLNRTELDPSDKRDFLLKIISCQAHGAITLLANDFSISRKSVYKARDAVLNAINKLTSEQTEPRPSKLVPYTQLVFTAFWILLLPLFLFKNSCRFLRTV